MNTAIAFLLVVFSMQRISAQGTAGQVILGYKFGADVTGYRGLSLDCSQIKAFIAARNWAAANAIFLRGKNSARGTVLRTLQGIASSVRTGELYYNTYQAFYGGPNYIQRTLLGGPAGSLTATVGVENALVACQWILLSYIGHELDAARALIPTAPAIAGVEVDDAFGVWYGYPNALGLWSQYNQIQTLLPCAGPLIPRVVSSFVGMRTNAVAKNLAGFNAQYAAFNKLSVVAYLRAVSYYGTKNNASYQKYAFGYLKMIQPLLVKGKAQAVQLSAILAAPKLANALQVRGLVSSLATLEAITPKDAGVC